MPHIIIVDESPELENMLERVADPEYIIKRVPSATEGLIELDTVYRRVSDAMTGVLALTFSRIGTGWTEKSRMLRTVTNDREEEAKAVLYIIDPKLIWREEGIPGYDAPAEAEGGESPGEIDALKMERPDAPHNEDEIEDAKTESVRSYFDMMDAIMDFYPKPKILVIGPEQAGRYRGRAVPIAKDPETAETHIRRILEGK